MEMLLKLSKCHNVLRNLNKDATKILFTTLSKTYIPCFDEGRGVFVQIGREGMKHTSTLGMDISLFLHHKKIFYFKLLANLVKNGN